jgi:hypothetical protein
MRYILGLGVVLAAANLTGMVERANAFQAPAGRAAVPSPAQSAATTAENAVQQNLLPGGTTTPVTNPANANQAPAIPGTVTASPSTITTTPAATNVYQTPPVPGTVTTNPAAGPTTTQGNLVPGTSNAGIMTNRTYSSNYLPATQPGMTSGTAAATTPGTTLAPGTYYQGTTVGSYTLMPTTRYSSMYVTPGYTTTGPVYYTTPTQTYAVQPRRGLFGGLFRRRYNQAYTTVPTNYIYTYNPAQGTYTYVPASY